MVRSASTPLPLLALAAAAALAGCKEREPAPTSAAAVAPAGGRGDLEGPRTGGHLVLPSLEPPFVNPALQTAFDQVTPLVFEGLVGLDARLEPQPRLAESWERSPNGREITFRLRRGVFWHDGKPFTSADVAFTVEQIRTARVSTPWRGYLASVDRVETPDAHTVKIHYRHAYAPALASWTVGILPKHLFEGHEFESAPANQAPVGTGPFKFVRWTPGRSIVLHANAEHWMGRPYVDAIEVVFNVPPNERLEALRSGRLDFTAITSLDDWSGVVQTPEFRERFETSSLDESSYVVIAWNNQRKPFADRRVRVALAHALDRNRVIEDVLKGSGRATSGPFFPTMWGGDPSVAPLAFDLERAAALLDEAGLKATKGRRLSFEVITLDSRRGAVSDEMFAIFRHDLELIGVELQVTYLPAGEFIDRLVKRDFDAALYRWVADIADPDPYVLLHSSQIESGANYPGYSNPDVDRHLEAARRTTDREERRKAYFALHRLVHEDQPYTFLHSPKAHYVWSRRLRGVNPLDVGSLPRLPGIARWWVVQ